MARKPTDAVQLKLRFSEALRRRLERAAARNNRSMNTEIIHRLEKSFKFEVVSERLARRGTPEGESELVPIGASDMGLRTMPDVLALIDSMNKKLDRIIDKSEAEESKEEGEKK